MAPHGIPTLSWCGSNHTHAHAASRIYGKYILLFTVTPNTVNNAQYIFEHTWYYKYILLYHVSVWRHLLVSIFLTGSKPQGFRINWRQKKITVFSYSLHSSLFIYSVTFMTTAPEVVWPRPHLDRHKRHRGGGGQKKPNLPKERKSRGVRRRRMGVAVQKPSYPLDMNVLYSQHKILLEWDDSPQGELVQCQSQKTERKKDCKTGRGGFHALLEVPGRTTVFLTEVFLISYKQSITWGVLNRWGELCVSGVSNTGRT